MISSDFLSQTLAALPDQDSFYDMVDGLEEQGMETVSQRHLGRKGTDLDLVEQLNIYEVWFWLKICLITLSAMAEIWEKNNKKSLNNFLLDQKHVPHSLASRNSISASESWCKHNHKFSICIDVDGNVDQF